ncbi:unnamed protein product [Adineta steineri]|uniref:Uncharacterized protein n=1 Tax=Adineta steineri TaxID=433720 RepID=A0A819RME7_9BILA|nr:unnamed protein product [Adineta steineri]CAF4054893.1 unnamed protein product [Adineta steineri]
MQPAVSIPDCSTWINMKNYPFLSWLLALYNKKIKNKDKLILLGHYCVIRKGFTLDNEQEDNETLIITRDNQQEAEDANFSLDYKYQEMKINVKYSFENSKYFIILEAMNQMT